MQYISIHEYDKAFISKKIERNNKLINVDLEHIKTFNGFGELFSTTKESLECKIALKEYTKPTLHFLQLATKAIEANFLFATKKAKSFQLKISDEEIINIELNDKFDASYKVDYLTYIDALYLAIIAKDKQALKNLLQIQTAEIKHPTSRIDDFFRYYADFLRSVLLQDGKSGELLIKAYEYSFPDKIKYAEYDYLEHNQIPHLEVWTALLSGDEAKFNQALLEALQKHKAYWGRDKAVIKGESLKFNERYVGFLSIPLTAICVLAKQNGKKINLKSDYIPEFLLGELTISH